MFDLARKIEELKELDAMLTDPATWERGDTGDLSKRRASLKGGIDRVTLVDDGLEEAELLLDLAEGESSVETAQEAETKIGEVEEALRSLEVERMLSGENDGHNAIVSIHPGAGGTEAQDWAEMLLRMYLRWSEQRGYKTEIVDYQPGEEAGVKSVTFTVTGENAYGYMKAEAGVHRLVRISPYDANKRRHTSFSSVLVTPEIEEDTDVEIDEADLRIDTYRSGGAGGQHVNKTDSAVRITHMPSKIVVQCQNERSQHKNKNTAMKILRSKLYELKMEEQREKLQEFSKDKKEIAWGSQIRSYVLQPYRMVKDHRTAIEMGNVDAVLDGSIDAFIEAYLLKAGSS
ncbi:MAG: peptide chain release factor 2 [Deltaproteobacteria bacterium]|nr:peptide chain release factor 2 [Deltaproteobacteria bacterium]